MRHCCECWFTLLFPTLLPSRDAHKGNYLVRQEITIAVPLRNGWCAHCVSLCSEEQPAGRHFCWTFRIRLQDLKDACENWHRLLGPFPRTQLPLLLTHIAWCRVMERTERTKRPGVSGISVDWLGFPKGPKTTCPR